jgi:hypothetical protein
MGRGKGELSPATLDLHWSHQVALSAETVKRMYSAIDEAGGTLGMAPRRHSVRHNDEWYVVFCFADPASAAAFQEQFRGRAVQPQRSRQGHALAPME